MGAVRFLYVVTEDQRQVVAPCGHVVVQVRMEVRTNRPNLRGSVWQAVDHACPAHVEPDRQR